MFNFLCRRLPLRSYLVGQSVSQFGKGLRFNVFIWFSWKYLSDSFTFCWVIYAHFFYFCKQQQQQQLLLFLLVFTYTLKLCVLTLNCMQTREENPLSITWLTLKRFKLHLTASKRTAPQKVEGTATGNSNGLKVFQGNINKFLTFCAFDAWTHGWTWHGN